MQSDDIEAAEDNCDGTSEVLESGGCAQRRLARWRRFVRHCSQGCIGRNVGGGLSTSSSVASFYRVSDGSHSHPQGVLCKMWRAAGVREWQSGRGPE